MSNILDAVNNTLQVIQETTPDIEVFLFDAEAIGPSNIKIAVTDKRAGTSSEATIPISHIANAIDPRGFDNGL